VLAGWTSFGLYCVWLSRVPSVGFRPGDDESGEGGGGGSAVDWDAFERDFAAYVERSERPDGEPELEPAAD
jgi:hypothetical protein